MGFDVTADAYGSFMGRYSEPLAVPFAAFAGVSRGYRVLDVGCGPGALTSYLTSLTDPTRVAAVDPSPRFVAAVAQRLPHADVRLASAEALPFPHGTFDAALAQLVVHFMRDPLAGLQEMRRVCRPGGRIAACVWDGRTGALGPFWNVVRLVDPGAQDESIRAGARQGHLPELFAAAGLVGVEAAALTVDVVHPTFEDWWEPYTLGVGRAGDYVASLDAAGRDRLATAARAELGDGPFTISATAWAAAGVVPED